MLSHSFLLASVALVPHCLAFEMICNEGNSCQHLLSSCYRPSTIFVFFFFFLRLHPQHMEVPRLAAGLHHSHSNTESEPCLWPIPQIMATLGPWPTEWVQRWNPHPRGYQLDSFSLSHDRTSFSYSFLSQLSQACWSVTYKPWTSSSLKVSSSMIFQQTHGTCSHPPQSNMHFCPYSFSLSRMSFKWAP